MKRTTKKYKDYEVFSQLKLPFNMPVIIRCDGRNFHKLSKELNLQRPFDRNFAEIMTAAAKEVYEEGFNPSLIYVFSDEINYIFTSELPFNRRLEKVLSIIPSIISSKFTSLLISRIGRDLVVSFDARAIPIAREEILGYLQWRQNEAWRNCVNSYAYHALLQMGYTPREASKKLNGLKYSDRHEIIFKFLKININNVPTWQRRGILVYKEPYTIETVNRKTGEYVKVERRKIVENWEPPLFSSEEGISLVHLLLNRSFTRLTL